MCTGIQNMICLFSVAFHMQVKLDCAKCFICFYLLSMLPIWQTANVHCLNIKFEITMQCLIC